MANWRGMLPLGVGAAVNGLMVLIIEAWMVHSIFAYPPKSTRGVLIIIGFVLAPLVWCALAASLTMHGAARPIPTQAAGLNDSFLMLMYT